MSLAASTSSINGINPVATPASTVPTSLSKPSFQDIDTDYSLDESDDDEESTQRYFEAASQVFSAEEIGLMIYDLKEGGLFRFINEYVNVRQIPVWTLLVALGVLIPPHVPIEDQKRILTATCSRILRHRERLDKYSTVDDAVHLIRNSKRIMVLTGAGVSTSCGIPDFRSPTGLYARLKKEYWELEDPQDMFDLDVFKEKPTIFYSFAKEIYPSNFVPSPCHRFVRLLELNQKLLRNYTQNIDGLFEKVGVEKILNCHGSFATASCLHCRTKFPGSFIEADVFAQRVPLCPLCSERDKALLQLKAREKEERRRRKGKGKLKDGWDSNDDESSEDGVGEWEGKPLIKPDIVFFGEKLSDDFDYKLMTDRENVDLLIVIGTSLRVSPVAQIVSHIPHSVPQILINRDPIPHANFDLVMLGDGDTIVQYLCNRLGSDFDLSRVPALQSPPPTARVVPPLQNGNANGTAPSVKEPERVETSNVWLFPGANGGTWLEKLRHSYRPVTSEPDSPEDESDRSEDERNHYEHKPDRLVEDNSDDGVGDDNGDSDSDDDDDDDDDGGDGDGDDSSIIVMNEAKGNASSNSEVSRNGDRNGSNVDGVKVTVHNEATKGKHRSVYDTTESESGTDEDDYENKSYHPHSWKSEVITNTEDRFHQNVPVPPVQNGTMRVGGVMGSKSKARSASLEIGLMPGPEPKRIRDS